MPTKVTVTLYQFDELNDKAKEKAREWWRECENQDFGGHGELNEPIETAANLLGVELKRHDVRLMGGGTRSEPNIWWQLHTQGSGASFEGSYAYMKGGVKTVKAEFPKDEDLQAIARKLTAFQKLYGYKATAQIAVNGREVHKYAMSLDAYNNQGEQLDAEAEAVLLGIMRDFADWIYKYIDAEYTYRMSDENVDDAMSANEYTFRENGTRSDG